MTDFFADLEHELRRAHARREHGILAFVRGATPRGPGVLRLATVTAAAAVAVSVVGLVLAGAPTVPERDLPPATSDPCAAPAPPPEVAHAFSVLARPAGPQDELPAQLRRDFDPRMEGLARIWLDDARFARDDGERTYFVMPALLGGTCEAGGGDGRPQPAVCVLAAAPYLDVPGCATVAQVAEAGLLLFSVPLDGGRWRTSVLVDDEAEPALIVGGRRVEGDVEGNVFLATFTATPEEQEATRIDVARQTLHSPDTAPPGP